MSQTKPVIFLTNREDHGEIIYRTPKITVTDNVQLLADYLKNCAGHTAYDIETNDNRFYTTNIMLISIGDGDTQFVVDATSTVFHKIPEIINDHNKLLYIGHNIKFDYIHSKTHGIFLETLFDTMVAEQRINLGLKEKANLVAVYQRRLNKMMSTDKDVRNEFIGMTRRSKFDYKHIVYSATDVSGLIDIARIQRDILKRYGQYEWVKENEFGLLPILADAELEGIALYEDKWTEIVKQKKADRYKQELILDQHIGKLLGRTIKERKKTTVVALDLFGAPTEIENKNIKHYNYNSSKAILNALGTVMPSLPMLKKKGKAAKPSLREAAIQQFIIDQPETPAKDFLQNLVIFKEHDKFINSYGKKFLNSEFVNTKTKKYERGYKNPVTKKVHTYYKPCSTDTGRLASGDVSSGLYNSQQLPALPEIRACFGLTPEEIAAGYYITSCDLTGAEAVIMAALANDEVMYDLAIVKDDIHSPVATECWQAVYRYRLQKNRDLTIKDTLRNTYTLTADFLINKKTNKQLRTDFKSFTFGTVYGMKNNTGAQTLGIPKDEAQVMINTIRNKFPKVFNMVEQAAKLAFIDGYVIFNSVSNNRRWFKEVLAIHDRLSLAGKDRMYIYNKVQDELEFSALSDIEGAARNCRIQGTQADMIKNAMVNVNKAMVKKNIPGKILLSVHDELVVKHLGREFSSDIEEIMTTTANRYLLPYSDSIKMKADAQCGTTWIK